MLVGRERECARLDALISQVRGGDSATLVVTGEAGVGKTSLLEHVVVRGSGLQVLRAHGVESEQDLPFAGLADLVGPILSHLGALPGPQRAALATVLVLTYRDDELDREHALHGLLGQASRSDHVLHLPLRRLSPEAVRQLSAGSTVDAADLFSLTSGNPFLVQELLASAQGERVPRTIVDAVLARVPV